jgi:hypothetical protein
MAAAAETAKKSLKDINIYSRKFILTIIAVAIIAYGMYYGKLVWKDGANYIAWVVSLYCLAEGHADSKNAGQIERILKLAIGGAGAVIMSPPTPPPENEPS